MPKNTITSEDEDVVEIKPEDVEIFQKKKATQEIEKTVYLKINESNMIQLELKFEK